MKYLLIFILLISVLTAASQKIGTPNHYLNNKKIDFEKTFLNLQNLDSIYVDRSVKNGAIYAFTDEEVKFLTLADIVIQYTNLKSIDSTFLFEINDKTLDDISGVSIDNSFYIYIEVTGLSRTNYIHKKFNDLKLIRIDLEQEKRKPNIRIRGDNNTVLNADVVLNQK